mmetsp:Transcript_33522/g.57476  ORF Transcript_33522/g.57476 Transcript_33522/m.57476 type:complete len:259 (-) Transcript_33522:383-1159(-)
MLRRVSCLVTSKPRDLKLTLARKDRLFPVASTPSSSSPRFPPSRSSLSESLSCVSLSRAFSFSRLRDSSSSLSASISVASLRVFLSVFFMSSRAYSAMSVLWNTSPNTGWNTRRSKPNRGIPVSSSSSTLALEVSVSLSPALRLVCPFSCASSLPVLVLTRINGLALSKVHASSFSSCNSMSTPSSLPALVAVFFNSSRLPLKGMYTLLHTVKAVTRRPSAQVVDRIISCELKCVCLGAGMPNSYSTRKASAMKLSGT